MASLVLTSAGIGLGNALLPGLGGQLLGMAGKKLGSNLDKAWGIGGSSSGGEGKRIDSIAVQDSRYGNGIPAIFGTMRVAGNVIWASDLIETRHESGSTGGKGGVLSSGQSSTTYTYSIHVAVAIGLGEIGGIQTIWADSKVIYQDGVWKAGVIGAASLYTGTMDQACDPLMQSIIGDTEIPAYKGIAYLVLDSLQLADFGSRLPSLTFEVYPKAQSVSATWTGEAAPDLLCPKDSLSSGGMPPLVIDGTMSRARKILVGGLLEQDASKKFVVIAYDVTGDAPVEVWRRVSGTFALDSLDECAWDSAADGRFVCLMAGTSVACQFALFDLDGCVFGGVQALSGDACGAKRQVRWIDALHAVCSWCEAGKRGVRVLARAGTSFVDRGFFDVWGSGSQVGMQPLLYAQFAERTGGGLFAVMADQAPMFNTISYRAIRWENGRLNVGDAVVVSTGVRPTGVGGFMPVLLPTGDGELTLFIGTTIGMMLHSFRPSDGSCETVRSWAWLSNGDTSYTSENFPLLYGDRIIVVQSYGDLYYSLAEIELKANAFALVSEGVKVLPFENGYDVYGALRIDGARFLITVSGGSYDRLSLMGLVRRRETGTNLQAVAEYVLEKAGYADVDYDVTAFADVAIGGYVLDSPQSAASVLSALRVLAPFDLVERDGQLIGVMREGDVGARIPESDLVFPETSEEASLQISRVQEIDLPARVTLDTMDPSRDYETGTQRASRSATRGASEVAHISLPVACSSSEAKALAEARLYTAWAEREEVVFSVSQKWHALQVGDVIAVGGLPVRVVEMRRGRARIDVRGACVATIGSASALQAEGASVGFASLAVVPSSLYLLDLPLLRNDDDQAGIYVAVGGSSGWRGASVWRSADGVDFERLATISQSAMAGVTASVLGDGLTLLFDRRSEVTVQLLQGELESCSEFEVLNGANVALCGDEILQFATATLVGPGCYKLSNFLRGRRGTEKATATHAIGERFVLLKKGGLSFVPLAQNERGISRVWTALSCGQSIGQGEKLYGTATFRTLLPYAPVHIRGERVSGLGSDLALTWKRRARVNAEWADNIDVPSDEDQIAFDVEILNGSNVVRSFLNVNGTALIYTAAQQTADWGGSVPSTFSVAIYQLSARVGRGAAGLATI